MNNKIVLVTGASKGIGAAVAQKFLEEGYDVIATYNTDELGAESLRQKYPNNVKIMQANFSSRKGILRFVDSLKNMKFDVIVNNAGVVHFEDFEEYDLKQWDDTMSVNLDATFIISQRLASNFKPNGALINIASTDGMTGTFASLAYAASKAAIITLTKGLGNVYGQLGIRANAIAPGWVDTEMSTAASEEAGSLTPLGRNAHPDEIADVAVFLASSKSSFVNGTTIIVDGGYTNVDPIMLKEALGEI